MPVLIEKRNLNGLIIDGTITESHSGSATVTSHPVAASSPISDHMYSNQKEITIVGAISDMPLACSPPLSRPRHLIDVNSDEFRRIPVVTEFLEQTDLTGNELNLELERIRDEIGISNFGSSGSSFDFDFSSLPEGARTSAALCRAYELMDNKEIVSLVTGLKVYDSMVVTSVNTEVNENRTNKIEISIGLREVKRVSARSTIINQLAATSGKGSKNRGKVKPDCLRLDQVFIDRAAFDTTNGDLYLSQYRASPSSETVEIFVDRNDVTGVYSPFNKAAYQSFICGRISKRYNTSASLSGDSLLNQTSSNNLIQEICEQIYIEESCDIPRDCNESIYNNIQGTADGTTVNNSLPANIQTNSSNAVNQTNQRTGAYAENRRDVAASPEQGLGSRLFVDTENQTVNVEFARLQCYYDEVLRRFESTTINNLGIEDYLVQVRLGLAPATLPPGVTASVPAIPPDTSN